MTLLGPKVPVNLTFIYSIEEWNWIIYFGVVTTDK
jgi:hypothetical protein